MNLENILKMTPEQLKKAVAAELRDLGYRVTAKKGFVYAPGEAPVLLVAHLDTVHRQPVQSILYSRDGTLMMSPEGIGGDDRAGVFAVLEIIKSVRCHVLLCEDEETGGHGAREFARDRLCPEVNYIVELDRRGGNDAVFYECDNPAFTDFVLGFGFELARGTFSDISVIAPALGVAAVNISAGYYNEHTRHEVINLAELQNNIERVARMARAAAEKFSYIEAERGIFSFFAPEEVSGISSRGAKKDGGKLLMPIPGSAHLKLCGQLIAADNGTYMIDGAGAVYDYLHDLRAAVITENAEAFNFAGTHLRFLADEARQTKVIPLECAMEQLEML
ncbi:MAG: hypothetical protein LBT36_03715 [Oscillospiraceae bacterium]|nr:hypothetical protein [Oscillospiraceae bacterium]